MKGPPAQSLSPSRTPQQQRHATVTAVKVVARLGRDQPELCRARRIVVVDQQQSPVRHAPVVPPSSTSPAAFDEARLAATKARKRKERQESVGSACQQDRKVIRSNSEERPSTQRKPSLDQKPSAIRRVSSSGDFPKSASIERINVASPNRCGGGTTGNVVAPPSTDKVLRYDDYEHEHRRSYERFARPLTLRAHRKQPGKRPKVRFYAARSVTVKYKAEPPVDREAVVSRKGYQPLAETHAPNSTSIEAGDLDTHDKSPGATFLQLHDVERDKSPSPIQTPVSPILDFSTLHEQVDCSEPLLSCPARHLSETTETMPSISIASNRLLSSPRNSIIATHRIYLDPDVPQTNISLEKTQNPIEERLQKLNKQINSMKKKIKSYESEFEAKNGFKPSHIDKLNDKNIKKLYADLSKLKKDQQQLSDMSTECFIDGLKGQNGKSKKEGGVSLQDTVDEIEKRLEQKRENSQRTNILERMSSEELLEEKVAMQKALLYLESIHGRPTSKEDRDIVRPFYDRYRILKRMVARCATVSSNGNELATIHENETMNFVTPPSSNNDSELEKSDKDKITDKIRTPISLQSNSTDSDTDTSLSENLHSMSKEELVELLKSATEEKKSLRRAIKVFEMEFTSKTGRMIQKEDKASMESVYVSYKKTKAKVRLLEALVGKSSNK